MKRILLFTSLFVSAQGFSQTTIFQDSFDSYNDFLITGFGEWRTLDLDLLETNTAGTDTPAWPNNGAPQAYQIFNPITAMVSNQTTIDDCNQIDKLNFNPRTGAKYAACWAGAPNTNGQTATANNDWLISRPINLTGMSGTQLSFWYKALSDCYIPELYRVGVYIGSGNPTQGSDFNIISGSTPLQATSYLTWTEQIYSLNAYNGQTIRIGIHCLSSDQLMFMVDDFRVTGTTMSTTDFASFEFSVYPNPSNNIVTISNNENIKINKVVVTDIKGRTVKILSIDGVSKTKVDISDLNAGVYFMSINTNQGIATKRIIKI
ncbi:MULTISPECIES: T9SS-dependent choice-of-anchor J family protein [Flavobacterium]|uniref:T9SS-dependent choice-of-anchor J family protein n=1 Tax=Flavobacterium TaxID=237 RepID=UPI001FCA8994|nr:MULTISPECIES: T9SS type A sorting domain-containing protein [Flavobacterium]UOK41674.1 T9SS type A sorting domain-containing protein [Flavobacterium enshiense]